MCGVIDQRKAIMNNQARKPKGSPASTGGEFDTSGNTGNSDLPSLGTPANANLAYAPLDDSVFASYDTAPGNMPLVKQAGREVVSRLKARGVEWSPDGDGDIIIQRDQSHRTVLFVSGSAGQDVALHRMGQRLGKNDQWEYDPDENAGSADIDNTAALDREIKAAVQGMPHTHGTDISHAFKDGPLGASYYLADVLEARRDEDPSIRVEPMETGGVLVKSKNGACGMTMRPDDEWGAVVTLRPHRADGTDGQPAERRMRDYRGGSGYSANAMRDAVSQACEYASPSPKPSGRRDYGAALKEGGAYRALGPEASEAVASATEYALLSARETPDVKVSHSGSVYLACGDPSHRRVRISTSRRKDGIWLSQAVERRGENGRWRADKGWSSSAVAVRAAGRERGDSENAESIIRDAVHNAQRVHRAD
jgi:hypothetical protein